jgi:protein-S-isoprenylcysteine O-methyltransferase Ste14
VKDMLDRKMKDYEASVELLEDRKKEADTVFLLFYIIGAIGLLLPAVTLYVSFYLSVMFACLGVLLLIVATWVMIISGRYSTYIFMIKKGLIQAPEKRE